MDLGSSFREAERMGTLLVASRSRGEDFELAWSEAIAQLRPGRLAEGGLLAARWRESKAALEFGKDAWGRAYHREPPTTLDAAVKTLAHAMDSLYDDSAYAEPQFIALPEAA